MTSPGTELRKEKTVGVVLFQLGGPDSPEAVEPFLYNLFCDPDIIQLPLGRARAPLARLLASKRASKVQHHYAAIGGRSPIRELTEQQVSALQAELSKSLRARVVLAMRYWHPLTEEAVAKLEPARPDELVNELVNGPVGEPVNELVDGPVDELVLLPLYPQYSKTTTGSSLNEWKRKYTARPGVPVHTVAHFYDHPVYIRALVEKINQGLERFSAPASLHLVFSAHGVPVSVVKAGDPYTRQTEETVRLVMEAGGWQHPHLLCYQSKVGSGRWVGPTLLASLRALGRCGIANVMVVPISFVTDHVETLNEINIQAREEASRAGITGFQVMPALNDSPTFIACLADLVRSQVSGVRSQVSASDHRFEPGT